MTEKMSKDLKFQLEIAKRLYTKPASAKGSAMAAEIIVEGVPFGNFSSLMVGWEDVLRHIDKEVITPAEIGNPYSLYNPFFSDKNVPTNKLYPGAFVTGDDYVVSCYQIKKELKELLLKKNPLYKFDETYKKYAFDGRAVQDAEIRIETEQPNAFRLAFVFKIHGKCLGIFHGYRVIDDDRLYY